MQLRMRLPKLQMALAACLAAVPLASQMVKLRPLTKPLACRSGDCPLLAGAPETAGMRSGFVRLAPGETVGWHTTGENEETLVVLHGRGAAVIQGPSAEGQSQKPFTEQPFTAPALQYIPPATRHNVQNTGTELLEYVYVVAPAKTR